VQPQRNAEKPVTPLVIRVDQRPFAVLSFLRTRMNAEVNSKCPVALAVVHVTQRGDCFNSNAASLSSFSADSTSSSPEPG
jgi:hypothetical protein